MIASKSVAMLTVNVFLSFTFFSTKTLADIHFVENFKPEQPPNEGTRFVYFVGPDRSMYNITTSDPYDAPNSNMICGYTDSTKGDGKKILTSPCQTSIENGKQEFKVTCSNEKNDMAFVSFFPNQVPDFSTAEDFVWAGFTSDPAGQPLRHSSDEDVKGKLVNDSIIVNCVNDQRTPLQ